MKVRTGFVSNSSSSSFIVIGNGEQTKVLCSCRTLQVPQDLEGTREFGWEIENHTDIGSRINFAYLQAVYKEEPLTTDVVSIKPKLIAMLEKVLKDGLHVDEIVWNLDTENYDSAYHCYIDHQSVGYDNLAMFENEDQLRNFIFCKDSYVHTDNDNH